MKAALISLGSVSSKLTAEAMKKYFDDVDLINIKKIEIRLGSSGQEPLVLYEGKPLGEYDCVFVKGSFNYAAIARAITAHLQKTTYMPASEEAFTVVHDKILSHIALEKYGIPSPPTYLSSNVEAAKTVLKSLPYPVVLKFPQGTQGKGVMVVDSFSAASSVLDALVSLKQPFIIQEFVETGGVDVRAFVVGDKVVAAMKRVASSDEKRSNIHAGGVGEAVTLSPKAKRVAIQAAKALGCQICGVDILESSKGPLVIEANISPGLQGIIKATGVDVADKIAKRLHEKTVEFLAQKRKLRPTATELIDELGGEAVEHAPKQIIMNVDFRGERILLPEFVSKAVNLADGDEAIFEITKSSILLKKQ